MFGLKFDELVLVAIIGAFLAIAEIALMRIADVK